MLKGERKLVGIFQSADIGKIVRIIGRHGIYKRIQGKNINRGVQFVKRLLHGVYRIIKSVLHGGKRLFLYDIPYTQISIQGKKAERKHDQQKICAQKLAFEAS